MMRQRPGSTLFPYTTLFRSVAAMGVNQLLTNNPVQLRVETTSESRPRYTAAVRVREKDRKSTRLNSSHVEISYAVFCLKKKIYNSLSNALKFHNKDSLPQVP